MPFVHDHGDVEWPDDHEPPPPRAEQFVYFAPQDFCGAPEPVRFSVPTEAPAAPPPPPPPPRGLLDRLLGRPAPSMPPPQSRFTDQSIAIMLPVLQEIGARRVYCRYDGGNDEGFAWFDSIETRQGERVDADSLATRLSAMRILDRLHAAGVMTRPAGFSDRDILKRFVLDELATEWAAMLLGRGFGTGEYSMYGAFTVDLDALTITDDRKADPIVENITIAE